MIKENLQKQSSVSARVSVEIDREKVNEQLTTFYSGIAKRAKIQGFRPGKAPVHVVKKIYGKEASDEITQRLISESLMEVIRKHELHIILPPTLLAVDSAKENQDFKFEAELDLKPEVPAVDLAKIEIEVPKEPLVDSAAIENRLKEIQDRFAHFHPLKPEASRPIKSDDLVVVKYSGYKGDTKVESASSERQELMLGTGQVNAEFEKAVIGLEAGAKKTFEIPFPEEHEVEEVRGQKIRFEMDILEVQEKHTPDLNDELAKRIDPQTTSLSELRAKLESQMKESAKHEHARALRKILGEALVKASRFEVSPRLKQMTAENFARDSVQRMVRMGMKETELKSRQEEIMAHAANTAEEQIRLSYILEKISRDQKLEVTKEDMDARLEKTAQLTGSSLAEIKEYYSQKEEDEATSRWERLKLDVLDEKSLDYALSQVRMKVREDQKV